MFKLYVVRHGETEWNAAGRIQGCSDIPLNAKGVRQAEQLAAHLADGHRFAALYSSPLRRAAETAEIISSRIGLPVIKDARLVERGLGRLEGLTMPEIREQFPDVFRVWHEGGQRPFMEGEEPRTEFEQRCRSFVELVQASHAEGCALAVTHGGTVGMLLAVAVNLGLEHGLPFTIDNASISILRWGERGARVVLLNDTCHLHGPAEPALQVSALAEQQITTSEVQ